MNMRILLVLFVALLGALYETGCATRDSYNAFSSGKGFQLTQDVPYDFQKALTLDVYRPPQALNAPVVVFFFGGRWSAGDKAEAKFVGQALASRGFVTVIPNLRKYPQVRFPAFVEDAAKSVRWAHNVIDGYGGDPKKLFVMGHSSGAHIAAMLAMDGKYLQQAGGSRDWLRGMIGLAGPYDFMPITAPDLRDLFGPPDQFPYSQPVFFADGSNPPLLLMSGRDDETVPVKNTESLAASVAKAGGTVETVIYDKLSHEMIVGSLSSFLRGRADVLDRVESFIHRTLTAPPKSSGEEIRATPLAETDSDVRSAPIIDYGNGDALGVPQAAPLIVERAPPESVDPSPADPDAGTVTHDPTFR